MNNTRYRIDTRSTYSNTQTDDNAQEQKPSQRHAARTLHAYALRRTLSHSGLRVTALIMTHSLGVSQTYPRRERLCITGIKDLEKLGRSMLSGHDNLIYILLEPVSGADKVAYDWKRQNSVKYDATGGPAFRAIVGTPAVLDTVSNRFAVLYMNA